MRCLHGQPATRGHKPGGAKRVRSRGAAEKKTPEVCIPRPVFQSTAHGESTSSGAPNAMLAPHGESGPSPSTQLQPATVSAVMLQPPLIQISSSNNAVVGQVSLTHSVAGTSPNPIPIQQPNSNPFYVRFIQGNIRVCQGCRSTLRLSDNSVPAPPFDLVVARAERRQFRDKFGTLVTPQREQASHYHLRLDCIKVAEPTFIGVSLRVPEDVVPLLSIVHREYLRLVFGIQ